MFVDSHKQNNKNERIVFRDASFYSLCEESQCRRVRVHWNEEAVYIVASHNFQLSACCMNMKVNTTADSMSTLQFDWFSIVVPAADLFMTTPVFV